MKFEPCLALRVPGFPIVFIISIRLFEIWPLGFESSLSDLLIPLLGCVVGPVATSLSFQQAQLFCVYVPVSDCPCSRVSCCLALRDSLSRKPSL